MPRKTMLLQLSSDEDIKRGIKRVPEFIEKFAKIHCNDNKAFPILKDLTLRSDN